MTDDAEPTPASSGWWRRRTTVLAVVVVVAAAASLVFDAEVDVPEWANVPGIDLPFVGDDPLVCAVEPSGGGVALELSGSPDTVDDYRHVWVNGAVVDGVEFEERRAQVRFGREDELHLAVSRTPDWDDRFWCGTITRP